MRPTLWRRRRSGHAAVTIRILVGINATRKVCPGFGSFFNYVLAAIKQISLTGRFSRLQEDFAGKPCFQQEGLSNVVTEWIAADKRQVGFTVTHKRIFGSGNGERFARPDAASKGLERQF